MKAFKPLSFKKLSINLIAKSPTKKLLKKPTASGVVPTASKAPAESITLKSPAPTTIGMERRNENLAAFSLLKPRSIPPEIVAPERENPGKRARD